MELNSLSAERRMPLISDWGWKWKGIWFFFTVDLSTVHLQIPPRFSGLLLLLLSRFSRVRLYATPQTAAHQAPLSLGFSRQEHWCGLPFPSPMHEREKWKWSRSVVSATPWTAAYQAPPSMGFSRQEYWSGVPLPSLSQGWRVFKNAFSNWQTSRNRIFLLFSAWSPAYFLPLALWNSSQL